MQTLVWYPAQASVATSMTVADYASLLSTETSFGEPAITSRTEAMRNALSTTLATPMWSVRDALPAPGRFPVIVYAPGFSSMAWENADLCEYLASHGYIVLASPNMGAMTREMTCDRAGVDTQARDISFLIGYAGSLPNTDLTRMAVIGFSWGGLSNLFAAARDNRIGALVALDGSLRYSPGWVREAGDVHPQRMSIPLLSFEQQLFTIEDHERYISEARRAGPSVLNAWTHADLMTVHMLGMVHWEFSSMYQRSEAMWSVYFPVQQKADYSRHDGAVGYAWMARYVREFVDAYLKGDVSSAEFLRRTPAENGVPRHSMATRFRAGSGNAACLDGLRQQVGAKGFDQLAHLYAQFRQADPQFELDCVAVESWADELMGIARFAEAIALLEFSAQLYPDQARAHAALAAAYRRSGQKARADACFRVALEKDPLNLEARFHLQEPG